MPETKAPTREEREELRRLASDHTLHAERAALFAAVPKLLDTIDALEKRLEAWNTSEPCYYCGKPINNLAANPGLWSVGLCHADEPGRVKAHHEACVSERLERLEAAEANERIRKLDDQVIESTIAALQGQIAVLTQGKEAAEQDTARLDWIFANWYRHNDTMRIPLMEPSMYDEPKSHREQLDAARKEGK